jgi:hypothetical protein
MMQRSQMVVNFPTVSGYPLGITRNPRTVVHSELHIGVLVIGLGGVEDIEKSRKALVRVRGASRVGGLPPLSPRPWPQHLPRPHDLALYTGRVSTWGGFFCAHVLAV